MPKFKYFVTVSSESNNNTSKKEYSEDFRSYSKKQCSQYRSNHEYTFDVGKIIDCFQDSSNDEDIGDNSNDEGMGEIITDALSIISTVTMEEKSFTYKKNELINFFEYYKLFIQDIKFEYSILVNSQISERIIEANSELTTIMFSFIDYIKRQYKLEITLSSISDQIKECLDSMEKLFYHKIKMILSSTEIRVINNFLDILRDSQLSSEYFYGKKCFALAYKGSFYFAVSGNDYHSPNPQIEALGKQIVGALSVSKPTYCIATDETPSYGYFDLNHHFVEYENVVLRGDGTASAINNVGLQYSCCERKIIHYINPEFIYGSFYKLRFIIKYAPCIDCSLALTKASNRYLYGMEIKYFFDSRKAFSQIKKKIPNWIKTNEKNGNISVFRN